MHILISAAIPVRYDEQLFSRGKLSVLFTGLPNRTSKTPHQGGEEDPHGRWSVKFLNFFTLSVNIFDLCRLPINLS